MIGDKVMVILAVDLGKVRTGIAVSDKGELLASPVCVIKESNGDLLIKKIIEIVNEYKVEEIVIGLPKNMDGTEGGSAAYAREFSDILREKTNLNIVMQDERGTTITAHNYLNITDKKGKKRKEIVDSVAAVIILQDYLDHRKNNKL